MALGGGAAVGIAVALVAVAALAVFGARLRPECAPPPRPPMRRSVCPFGL